MHVQGHPRSLSSGTNNQESGKHGLGLALFVLAVCVADLGVVHPVLVLNLKFDHCRLIHITIELNYQLHAESGKHVTYSIPICQSVASTCGRLC